MDSNSFLQNPVIPIFIGFLGAGLQMTNSKRIGVGVICFSLLWLWYLFIPVAVRHFPNGGFLLLFGGWAVIALVCGIWWWKITPLPTPSPPPPPPIHVSSSQQGGGITAQNVAFQRAVTIQYPPATPSNLQVELGEVLVANQHEAEGYRTVVILKIVSPQLVGNLRLVIYGRTVKGARLFPRSGIMAQTMTRVRDGQILLNMRNASGELELVLVSSEPIGPTNEFRIEPGIG